MLSESVYIEIFDTSKASFIGFTWSLPPLPPSDRMTKSQFQFDTHLFKVWIVENVFCRKEGRKVEVEVEIAILNQMSVNQTVSITQRCHFSTLSVHLTCSSDRMTRSEPLLSDYLKILRRPICQHVIFSMIDNNFKKSKYHLTTSHVYSLLALFSLMKKFVWNLYSFCVGIKISLFGASWEVWRGT